MRKREFCEALLENKTAPAVLMLSFEHPAQVQSYHLTSSLQGMFSSPLQDTDISFTG